MDVTKLIANPASQFAVDTDTNAATSAELAAPGAGKHLIITGVSLSADRAFTAARVATLKDGSTVIKQWELPAAAIAPIEINFRHPLKISENATASMNCEAGGASVKVTVGIAGFTTSG